MNRFASRAHISSRRTANRAQSRRRHTTQRLELPRQLKKNVDKGVLVNLIGSISNPLLYILSIDIKSAQNKILNVNLGIGENDKFCSDFKENFMIKFFRNSMKTCLFLNFGKYLLLLFTKKKFFFFSSKTSFSKIFFFNFLLFKANK
jgi:hypothetical protein